MALETLNSPAARAVTAFDSDRPAASCAWTKRKRSRRSLSFHPQSEEEYLALCLIMLTRGRKSGAHEDAAAACADFKCRVCDMSFHSYHALSGHQASHKKVSHGSSSTSVEDDGDSGIFSASLLGGTGRSHECLICGRSFASGQALGGHKRSHYDRRGGKRIKGIGVSVSEMSGRRWHDFDLNQLPPAEEQEEVESPCLSKKARLSTGTEVKSEAVA